MLEIEEKIKENAQKLAMASKKSKADAKLSEAAKSAVMDSPVKNDDVSISADDDFEEFAPAGDEE